MNRTYPFWGAGKEVFCGKIISIFCFFSYYNSAYNSSGRTTPPSAKTRVSRAQGRIQDFPGGAPTLKVEVPTYYFRQFPKKPHENEKIGHRRGSRPWRLPPLRPLGSTDACESFFFLLSWPSRSNALVAF